MAQSLLACRKDIISKYLAGSLELILSYTYIYAHNHLVSRVLFSSYRYIAILTFLFLLFNFALTQISHTLCINIENKHWNLGISRIVKKPSGQLKNERENSKKFSNNKYL